MSNNIIQFSFDETGIENITNLKYGKNWPVVYILNGDKEAYIGETTNVCHRMKQHKSNTVRKTLNKINIIYDSEFNKSAVLDIESLLINYMSADQKYRLQNISSGINSQSDYYNRSNYLAKFDNIWNSLIKKGIADHDRIFLENLDVFKFSPYKTLTEDQYDTAIDIIKNILEYRLSHQKGTFIVNGNPGTGKSVLAVYLMKLLIESQQKANKFQYDENINYRLIFQLLSQYNGKLKVGLVIPMESLRKTLKNVFKQIDGLKANMVIGPSEVIKDKYDILIVDEAHRLRRRVNLMPGLYHTFDNVNQKLNIRDGDELDWIIARSQYQILFYDSSQSIKPSDVRKEKFQELINQVGTVQYTLMSQMRVQGGEYYISAIDKLLHNQIDNRIQPVSYDLKIYDDVEEMYRDIRIKDKEFELCRMVAGYAWAWSTKNVSLSQIKVQHLYDISINEYKYIWNTINKDWVNSSNAINEIGCIHTIQGYDLNYVGVIIGPELKYDRILKKIYIDKNHYYDMNGKKMIEDEEELFNYIINIYKVLLTRGIKGTYIYVCDDNLRDYFKKYIRS